MLGQVIALLLTLQEADPFPVTVDGKPYKTSWISFGEHSSVPRQGDLVKGPDDVMLMVGTEKGMKLRRSPREDGRLFLETEGGASKVVGVGIHWGWKDGKQVVHNPLKSMSPEQLLEVRGITLDLWDQETIDSLRGIDPARTCISLRLFASPGQKVAFPSLPKDLRYLVVNDGNLHLQDLSPLASLTELRWLELDVNVLKPFDASILKDLRRLERLDYRIRQSEHLERLGSLSRLRLLNVGWTKLSDISFAKNLKSLEEINLDRTEVQDLSPLGSLPALRTISADRTPVDTLPQGEMVSLRELSIMSTKVADEAVRKFEQAHPKCSVRHRWSRSLSEALTGITKLRIRSGGLCHRQPDAEKLLFESEDPAVVREFAALLQVEEDRSGFHCMCCGDPSLEFYKGKELKVEIGFHHGQSLRWRGWPGDGAMPPEVSEAMIRWLATHGVDGPLKAREGAAESAKAEEAKFTRAMAGLSPTTIAAFKAGEKEFAAALEKELPDRSARIDALFRILGTSTDSWTMLEPIEQHADNLLKTYDKEALIPRAEAALTGTNRVAKRGAARFWLIGNGPLGRWTPDADSKVWSNVIELQQEARYYPLRQEALKNLRRWQKSLTPEFIEGKLHRGLRDPQEGVRRQALLTAGQLPHPASAGFLVDALAGKPVEPLPLLPVPSEEERPLGDQGYDTLRLSVPECAALGLGWMKHEAARQSIRSKAGSAAFDVALALMGEVDLLKAEHFNGSTQSMQIQVAALEAVVRCKGRRGLKEAVGYQQTEYWWEPEYAVKQITGMLKAEGAPGMEQLGKAKKPEDLKSWFDAFGAEYLKRFER